MNTVKIESLMGLKENYRPRVADDSLVEEVEADVVEAEAVEAAEVESDVAEAEAVEDAQTEADGSDDNADDEESDDEESEVEESDLDERSPPKVAGSSAKLKGNTITGLADKDNTVTDVEIKLNGRSLEFGVKDSKGFETLSLKAFAKRFAK